MKEYIERAQLLKNLGYDEKRRADVLPGSMFDIVLKEPTADVASVRHGKWIDNTFCSCCGGFDEDDKGNIIQSFHNYCPACGALMDGKEAKHD